ncbi:MAG: magnesium transporter NIPA-domain-containing protein [Linnemannia gamsii]|nr:MAG: magnesium transporter NIPA-domain-containing protein [Linnemannia gamsii]
MNSLYTGYNASAAAPSGPLPMLSSGDAPPASDSSKIIGLSLAIGSGLLIGSSFVFKKKGLINCTKDGMLAGEGHAYLKSVMWWTGMLMMVVGEVCNFVAYAFVQPILVTPLGALSVVICAILSSIFLRERLNMQGKVGCAQCIVGATIIVFHAPEQASVKTIQEFKHLMIQPGFLVWMALIIIASSVLIIKAGPRWGKEHMMIYIGVCSLIGSLSVVATQGLGAAIVHNISTGEAQFDNWFIYFVIVFMVVTLLTEINYLNKALNLFNTAMVTPTYYVTFTSTTIITSAILYQGFNASVTAIITVCLGFLVICGGVLLLQTSKPVVPFHMPGSSAASIIGTISYDDIEPTAADMRASPFSSIRRITRDLRQPSIISTIGAGGGTGGMAGNHSVFQSSPLNPRAESLLQRKRAVSNAALRSRPQSIIGGHHHLAVPGAAAAGSVAGGASAFYPSTTGAYSTMVMGPNGSQIRLQLCEIVVSDEKHETSRYQVYRPVPPHGDISTATTAGSPHAHNEKGDLQQLRPRANSTGFKYPFLAPRGSLLTDSRSSSIRFSENPTRSSIEESTSGEKEEHSAPSSPKHSSPISGSLFMPPKLAISPPTPDLSTNASTFSPPSAGASDPEAVSVVPAVVGAGTPKPPPSGPMAVGGSFFRGPRFRSASTASGDIMEMNDPGHAGRSVVVTIEPVQQQPLFSLYVPPQPLSTTTTLTPKPTLSVVNSTSSTSATSNASDVSQQLQKQGHQKETSRLNDESVVEGVESHGDDDDNNDPSTLTPTTVAAVTTKPKRGFFGKLFSKSPPKPSTTGPNTTTATGADDDGVAPETGSGSESVSASGSEDPLSPSLESSAPDSPTTSATPLVGSTASPATAPGGAHPALFNRTNHPTRISEGDEEDEEEELRGGGGGAMPGS